MLSDGDIPWCAKSDEDVGKSANIEIGDYFALMYKHICQWGQIVHFPIDWSLCISSNSFTFSHVSL